jgi:hypothetical protein
LDLVQEKEMAKRVEGVSQSSFIREKLNADRDVKYRVVADAWKSAGHPGEIKSSLFYLVKNKMGLAGGARRGRPGRKPKAASASAAHAPSTSASGGETSATYREIEETLDSLIRQANELRNSQLAEDLRAARRQASIQLV